MTRKTIVLLLIQLAFCIALQAQDYNSLLDDGTFTEANGNTRNGRRDSTKAKDKVIPKGLKVWTVDERLGDRIAASPDTVSHMFQNSIFTTGMRSEYNSTGNLGAPRINRIVTDRPLAEQFIFTQPYDYFVKPVSQFLFTNTLSPITNLTFNECGDRTNGEDHLKALFAVNVGKKLGVGFNFDYIYGRGYYNSQSTSHFNFSLYSSYLGERYNAHFLFTTNHQKVAENGGIKDDRYITHPEMFNDNYSESEIPTAFSQNWNRNDNQHIYFSHRYNIGFNRKVKMTEDEIKARKFAIESKKENDELRKQEEAKKQAKKEGKAFDADEYARNNKSFGGRPTGATIGGDEPEAEKKKNDSKRIAVNGKAAADSLAQVAKKEAEDTMWMKNEYVPVTSIIHTLKFDNYQRIYQAYEAPDNYYTNNYIMDEFFQGDSIYDKTRHYSLKNTFGLAMLEGFNKWAKAGIKLFATYELRHFTLPAEDTGIATYNEHCLSVGGELSKREGRMLHYNATVEAWLTGEDAGQIKVDGHADLNFRLFGDTVQLAANAAFYHLKPTFYFRHYHSRHYWWDNSLDKEIRTRVEGLLTIKKTNTQIRVAFDDIKNYTYLSQQYTTTSDYNRVQNSVEAKQASGNITLFTAQLNQNFKVGPLHWDNSITYQKSSNQSVLPVPALNVYTNLFLRFKIAKVLNVDLGADARYFTKYEAPEYSAALGQYTVQGNGSNNVKVGNYPLINVYANMTLKKTRFFIMMSHVNASNGNYFFTPHHPLNSRVLRFGLSWDFFN